MVLKSVSSSVSGRLQRGNRWVHGFILPGFALNTFFAIGLIKDYSLIK